MSAPATHALSGVVPTARLTSSLDTRSASYLDIRAAMADLWAGVEQALRAVPGVGGERSVARHRARGKMLVRERIEHLIDPRSPFLELTPLAGWGTDDPVGAGVVVGPGVVAGVEVLANGWDMTSKGASISESTVRKVLRMYEIAERNRLPLITLNESAGADLAHQADIFVSGGAQFKELAHLSRLGIPTVNIGFGPATAGGAYLPGMSDYVVMVRSQATTYLGGPPLVKMAIDETADEETLGGSEMHARTSGLADYLAEDEHDAIRIGRDIVAHPHWRRDQLVCGWGSICGFPVGVIANNGILFSEEAGKGAQFIQLCNRSGTPLIFVQNITGFMVDTKAEQGGIIRNGAKLINAVSNSTVPHITVMVGASYGAGNYGMSGRAYDPRFVFSWPNHRIAVMGPRQLAGVMEIVARNSAAGRGEQVDEAALSARSAAFESQVESESTALFATGRVWDDGIIDPRDTRTMLGVALSVSQSAPTSGATE